MFWVWFVALVFSLLFLIGVVNGADFLERLERIAYDAGIQAAHRNPGSAENIVIVAIDDDSIQKIGRWPWPRSVLAEVSQARCGWARCCIGKTGQRWR